MDDEPRAGVSVGWRVHGGEETFGADVGAQPLCFPRGDHAAGHAEAVLDADAGLEVGLLLLVREQEQIADGVEPDAGPWPGVEVLVGVQAAVAELDVERVGELGAYA